MTTKLPFKKEKEFIFCIDSDGCVMDTMNYKHRQCFGPLAADIWNIQLKDVFLSNWNHINLFSETRGINRFEGLILTLKTMQAIESSIMDFSYLAEWVHSAPILSNSALQDKIAAEKNTASTTFITQLERALTWSINVNKQIKELSHTVKPFDGAADALKFLYKKAHIAVVSSANYDAIEREWYRHGLSQFVDIMYGQEAGSKSSCIKEIISYPFSKEKVLMIGDSPGDLSAAKDNEISFYPILFGKEKESWDILCHTAVPKMLDGTYTHSYQNIVIEQFRQHLGL